MVQFRCLTMTMSNKILLGTLLRNGTEISHTGFITGAQRFFSAQIGPVTSFAAFDNLLLREKKYEADFLSISVPLPI